jgi:hypothetical protein
MVEKGQFVWGTLVDGRECERRRALMSGKSVHVEPGSCLPTSEHRPLNSQGKQESSGARSAGVDDAGYRLGIYLYFTMVRSISGAFLSLEVG